MLESGRVCPTCHTSIPAEARTCPSCGAISLPGVTGAPGDVLTARLRTALGQRYRIERELGEGGMALVFLARDLRHDRPVALKVLRPELAVAVGEERFLREIHIAAQLNHPHILPLHDSGEADGLLFYVMPYEEGESLRQRLARGGPLAVGEAVRYAREIADALAEAHGRGVIHRDIKPGNILLARGHAVVADFGIARAVADASSTLTGVGAALGTPGYMSPEQAAGDPNLDHRTDLYALGCVLFEMLTGHPPYPGPTPQALLAQHATAAVPSPRHARTEVPPALDALVRRAMAKNLDTRFQSAQELGAALGELAAEHAPARRPAPVRLRRLALGAAGAAVATAAVILVLRRGAGALAPAAAPLSVLVQPFRGPSGQPNAASLRLSDALTDRLQAVPALNVTSPALLAPLRNATLDTLRARFAPDRVVVGLVDSGRDSLRVSADILDPRTARTLASRSFAVPAAWEYAATDSLSAFAREFFAGELLQARRRARVHDPAAWALVARADTLRSDAEQAIERRLDRQGFRSLDVADSLLREAGRRDGASDLIPLDRARIADQRGFYVEYLRQALPNPPAGLPDPAAERRRALAMVDALIRRRHGPADAYALRGRILEGLYRETGGDSLLDRAVADYQAATELDRHNAVAWMRLGSAYTSEGRYDDALLAFQHGSEEDAFQLHRDELLRGRFDAAFDAERFALADTTCRTGRLEFPASPLFTDCQLQLWSRTRRDVGSATTAEAVADSLNADASGTLLAPLRRLWVADVLARAGAGQRADRLAAGATTGAPRAWLGVLLPECAYLRLLRGQPDSALALVRLTIALEPMSRRAFRTQPWYRPLAADPQFRALVAQSATVSPSR